MDALVPAAGPAKPVGATKAINTPGSQLRQALDSSLETISAAPAASVSLETLLGAATGGPEAKARLTASLQAFGAVSGTVVESGPDNQATIDIGGVPVKLKLGRTYAPGETVVIALARHTGGAQAGTDAQISRAGELIASLLAGDGAATETQSTAATLKAQQALALSTSPQDVPALAARLEQAIRSSGLFYESHLAAWADGRLSLSDIRREPQSRIGATGTSAKAAAGAAASAVAAGTLSLQDLPPEIADLVRQQLDALEHGAVRWRGSPWDGQQADLVIEDEAQGDARPGAQHGQPGQPQGWRMRLKLDLPALGMVDALVQLKGKQVSVQLLADEQSQASLRAGAGSFAQSLAARGFTTDGVQVAGSASGSASGMGAAHG